MLHATAANSGWLSTYSRTCEVHVRACGARLSRDGANETNNMLAALDDISNLNLNNLAGSARGLWDHARTFFLLPFYRVCTLSISHTHLNLHVSLVFYRSRFSPLLPIPLPPHTATPECFRTHFASLMNPACTKKLGARARGLVTYKVINVATGSSLESHWTFSAESAYLVHF